MNEDDALNVEGITLTVFLRKDMETKTEQEIDEASEIKKK